MEHLNQIETMTPEEATEKLRAMGMKISPVTVRDGLEQKVFPFGYCIQSDKGRRFTVFTRLFNEWVAERATCS